MSNSDLMLLGKSGYGAGIRIYQELFKSSSVFPITMKRQAIMWAISVNYNINKKSCFY